MDLGIDPPPINSNRDWILQSLYLRINDNKKQNMLQGSSIDEGQLKQQKRNM